MTYLPPLSLKNEEITTDSLKDQLALFSKNQIHDFHKHRPVSQLITDRTTYFDQLLHRLWDFFELSKEEETSLIAVGGFGRKELHPLSDIDILILTAQKTHSDCQKKIEQFIAFLWDLKLEIGHSVRSLDGCLTIGKLDLSVITNLQESRYIAGNKSQLAQLKHHIRTEHFWSNKQFFHAKIEEQKQRHSRYNNTTYNLEPNIKLSPGGLRDIHTLGWIAYRHLGSASLLNMHEAGFLTDSEYQELIDCRQFLWRIRFALHIELKRHDNRLTFDHQSNVATHLGFKGEKNQHVEEMMKTLYRTLRRVEELNNILLKIFRQVIIKENKQETITAIHPHFQLNGHLIELKSASLFQQQPELIIELFILIANNPAIKGLTPNTRRQLRIARYQLKSYLINIPEARERFLTLLQHPNALKKALGMMHRFGVLAAYLPQWNQIVGQMQFDLFHVYTVDEHTIRLLQHIHTFSDISNKEKHPICCEVFPKIEKKELLFIAAIFHDIAKGRQGDHSELGAIDAYDFCITHHLSKPDAKLVSWLVENHLIMSITAQRRDISDPDIIIEFAKQIKNEERLNYLICLTVADICATNPDLWNGWKRTLLSELYYSVQKALRDGIENTPGIREHIRYNQQQALTQLLQEGVSQNTIDHLWKRFKVDYFLKHNHQQIVWHTQHLLRHSNMQKTLILMKRNLDRGGTEIFIYSKDKPYLFATVAAELDRRNITIYDAQIMTSKDGFAIDTFTVLAHDHQPIDEDKHQRLIQYLYKMKLNDHQTEIKTRRTPRQLQHFSMTPKIRFLSSKTQKYTLMEFISLDYPGLLATIGATFVQLNINLHAAKITTIGERAENIFTITSDSNEKLTEKTQKQLKEILLLNVGEL